MLHLKKPMFQGCGEIPNLETNPRQRDHQNRKIEKNMGSIGWFGHYLDVQVGDALVLVF